MIIEKISYGDQEIEYRKNEETRNGDLFFNADGELFHGTDRICRVKRKAFNWTTRGAVAVDRVKRWVS